MPPKLIEINCAKAQERFWKLVQKGPECWLWLGSPDPNGKGVFRLNRKTKLYAHRLAWILCNGPTSRTVRVICGNDMCVNPAHMEIGRSDTAKRFWQYVQKGQPDDCWPWTGGRHGQGYGQFQLAPRLTVKAHRMAFQLATKVDPVGLEVMHQCDNPPCCNPQHLKLGTHQDNMTDAVNKGRFAGNGRPPRAVRLTIG